jgi:hypothetical protein
MNIRTKFVMLLLIASGLAVASHSGNAAPVPPDIFSQMRPGAISLQLETRKLASYGDVLLHLSVVPKGHSREREVMLGEKRTGPVRREHIDTMPSVEPSPFYLDFFTRRGGSLKRLNSVRFIETKNVQEIVVRWLEPARRRGPVFALRFGFTHWSEWVVITFLQGLNGTASVQQFLFGGESGTGIAQRFDRVDKRGFMMVQEDSYEPNEKTKEPYDQTTSTIFYYWDGLDFADRAARYFVIAASVKSRAEAEAFVRRHQMEDVAQIRPSSHYAKLHPGYFIVILSRHRNKKEALERAGAYRNEGASVRRAI